ncbi:transposase [Nonomuraea muscovyensis]|nr:transposase [Nonomuraea muscovyensis]
MTTFAEANADWLRIYQMPAYAPELNPDEGVWSLLKRAMGNFVVANLPGLVRIIKRKLRRSSTGRT